MSDSPTPPAEATMFLEKSAFFRVIHADGTLISRTPSGNWALTFYNDRAPLPKTMVVTINEQAEALGEVREKRNEVDGYEREVETEIVMSRAVAERLWRRLGQDLGLSDAPLENPATLS